MECLRLLVPEPDIFHFRLDAVKTKPMGKRNEDKHCFTQNLVPLMFRHELDCATVMEAVSQFDKYYPHIVIQGQKNALEILGLHALLLSFVFVVQDSLDLGKSLD